MERQKMEEIVIPLLAWYQNHARTLPWRSDPTFYHVWVSEVMLQQTRVEAVKEYYLRFMKALPTIESLAKVKETELLKLWEGLGYYNRVRNMQKAAGQILSLGYLPHTYAEILSLKGIGPYTAGAISSIVYQIPVCAIDGNVLRVVTRLTADSADITLEKTKTNIAALLTPILPIRPGDFNQALMELGATICLPNGEPLCQSCPLAFSCQAKKENRVTDFPVKKPKKDRLVEEKTIFIFLQGDEIAIQKRPSQGLLAGLFEFPNVPGQLKEEEVLDYLNKNNLTPLEIIPFLKTNHIFTHRKWEMTSYIVILKEETKRFLWKNRQQITTEVALPTAFRQFYIALETYLKGV